MQRVIKSGHSLAVTIPNKFARALGIHKGDEVQVEKRPDRGTLTFHFKGVLQMALGESLLRRLKK